MSVPGTQLKALLCSLYEKYRFFDEYNGPYQLHNGTIYRLRVVKIEIRLLEDWKQNETELIAVMNGPKKQNTLIGQEYLFNLEKEIYLHI